MNELRFVQIQKGNDEHGRIFEGLMLPYFAELDEHQGRQTSVEFILEISKGMVNMQGPHDRHLEIVYQGIEIVGFLYGKVDHAGHKGFIKPEYGYVMEFYVKPEYRRRGYGAQMAGHIEALFRGHGVNRMYLTADAVTGVPFWEAMGFVNTGEKSPENNQFIFEKGL